MKNSQLSPADKKKRQNKRNLRIFLTKLRKLLLFYFGRRKMRDKMEKVANEIFLFLFYCYHGNGIFYFFVLVCSL